LKVNVFQRRKGSEEMGLHISVVSATDTIVDGNKKLGCESEPKGTGRSDVVGVAKTMGEEFLDPSESLEGDSTLRGVGKFVDLERIGDGDRVRVGSVFDGGIGEFTKGDRDRDFRNVGDVGIHVVRKRPRGKKGGRERR